MTEQVLQTPAAGAESPVDGQTVPGQGNDTGEPETGSQADKGLREARDRYRGERDAARDDLAAAKDFIEALQTRELERIAAKTLSNPADLLTLSGKSVTDFLDEGGELDMELITEAANDVLGSRPGLRPYARVVDPTQGLGNNLPGRRQPTLHDLLKS